MKVNTRKRKESRKVFKQLYGRQKLTDRMYRIILRLTCSPEGM